MTTQEEKKRPGFKERKPLPVPLTYNLLSMIGFLFTLLGIAGIFGFFLLDLFAKESLAYQGIAYVSFFVLIVIGFLIYAFGYFREKKRRASGKEPSLSGKILTQKPIIALFFSMALVVAATIVVGTSSYKVYEYTESNEFCGTLCHSVMNPEYITYHNSSHARVDCVACHIGSGAGWYVKSKLSGVRQLFATIMESYPKPILTPIHNLRPARETCEECHWPDKFIGQKDSLYTYYLSDEENTPFKLRMTLKIGGQRSHYNKSGTGIHYHMQTNSKVEYIATDYRRQKIAWVRSTKPDGTIVIYNDSDEPLKAEEVKQENIRQMDCMDCHNRPAHKYPTPMDTVNLAIDDGTIPKEVPAIKLQAVTVMDHEYTNSEEAKKSIRSSLEKYYKKEFSEFIEEQPELLEKAILGTQKIYARTIFPEMKAKWSAYPDNIGHKDWPGCFRCHNDVLESEEDEQNIDTTCNICHSILAQGEDVDKINASFNTGLDFMHPWDDEPMSEYTHCADCHTGGKEVYDN